MTQLNNNCKKDRISQTKLNFQDLKITSVLSFSEKIAINSFERELKLKSRSYFFDVLQLKQKTHSKMKNFKYEKFEIQDYLLSDNISIDFKKILFMWRTRMATFCKNYRGGRDSVTCHVCLDHEDSQEKSFDCPILKERITMKC